MFGLDAVQQRYFLVFFLIKNRMTVIDFIFNSFLRFLVVKGLKLFLVEDLDTVAAVFLGFVQGFIGGLDQGINVIGNFKGRNTDTDRKANLVTFVRMDHNFGNRLTQAVGHGFGFLALTPAR